MWGSGYGFMGGFMMLAFWGALIALVVFLGHCKFNQPWRKICDLAA